MFNNMTKSDLTTTEIKKTKVHYAKRWLDPIARIEDTFNIRRADGSLVPLKVPEPQKQMIRDGILGKSRELVGTGVSYIGVTDKGRQLGFSVIMAAEQVLIAEEFPGTNIYYVATTGDQATDWMTKLNQLVTDANHWPQQLGGGSILNITSLDKVFEKIINGTHIFGLSANPPGIRGKTGISVNFDEAAWAIRFKNQAKETWKALKYIIRQGGQARIQSTPRTSDTEEFFWGFYKKGEAGNLAIHDYYCPVITNWKDLDLTEPLYIELNNRRRKMFGLRELAKAEIDTLIRRYEKRTDTFIIKPGDCIKQKAEIPYWWVSLQDLETDRASDLEQFKQENLGIPVDEMYKLLKTEWIYSNLNEGAEWDSRCDSNNPFYFTIDLAQVKDLTALTITEKIENIYIERRIEETQATYPEQVDLIFDLFLKFRPLVISIDNTGHGIVVGDMLVRKLTDNGFNPGILKRITFTQTTKEQMAIGFRNLVMPDPITGKSRYRWLNNLKKHENAIRHCTRVEKQTLPMGGTRYTGKMHGRDDHFWSKAQIALLETPTGVPRASLGRVRNLAGVHLSSRRKSMGNKFLEDTNRKRMEINPEEIKIAEDINRIRREKVVESKNLKFALQCLTKGIVVCRSKKKAVRPVHCAYPANCIDPFCPGFKYVNEICERYGVEKNDVWRIQKEYPVS